MDQARYGEVGARWGEVREVEYGGEAREHLLKDGRAVLANRAPSILSQLHVESRDGRRARRGGGDAVEVARG